MRTEGITLIAALALHAGVLVVARTMPPLSLLTAKDQRDLRTIDIELPTSLPPPETREAPPIAPPTDTPTPAPAAEARPTENRAIPREAVPAAPNAAAPATGEPVAGAPPAATATSGSKFSSELPPDDGKGVLGVPGGVPGLGGTPVWGISGVLTAAPAAAPAPTVAPAPRPVDPNIAGKVINDALSARDKDLGVAFPAQQNIASAVRTAVNGSEIPTGTKGSIECRVSPKGTVTCRLLSATAGGPDAWAGAVRAASSVAVGALSGTYANGAVVTLDIKVTQELPSGNKGGLNGASLSFDTSNIGAHPVRMVRVFPRVVAAR